MLNRLIIALPISLIMAATGIPAFGQSLHVFEDAKGGIPILRNKLEVAKSKLEVPQDFADLNNLCVLQALNGNFYDAIQTCETALNSLRSENLSPNTKRSAIAKIEANLFLISEKEKQKTIASRF